jgi:hypothetical protein
MSQSSTRLSLPYIQPAQSQKHVTNNEAIRALDLLVQLTFKDDQTTTPPSNPDEGDCYVIPSNPVGVWAGQEDAIATYLDGAWQFTPPQAGWSGYVISRGALAGFTGTQWTDVAPGEIQDASFVGLGMQADVGAPFSAKVNAALWTAHYAADGGTGDLLQTLNKETAGHDTGFVFQEGFDTRALVGLFGDNRLRFSVTTDGSNFADGLSIDPSTGIADLPTLPRFSAYTSYDNYVGVGTWTKLGINTADYNEQGDFDAATNRFTAPVDGTYTFGANLTYKTNGNASARMQGRFVLNGSTALRGSKAEVSGTHLSEETTLPLQAFADLNAGDTVELQANFRAFDGYIMADETTFWGHKVG